jgi:hypothetical protein
MHQTRNLIMGRMGRWGRPLTTGGLAWGFLVALPYKNNILVFGLPPFSSFLGATCFAVFLNQFLSWGKASRGVLV